MTMNEKIRERLTESAIPLAVHEFAIFGHSENSMATAVSIMARQGEVEGRTRPGKRFKEWALTGFDWGTHDENKAIYGEVKVPRCERCGHAVEPR